MQSTKLRYVNSYVSINMIELQISQKEIAQ